MIEFSRVKILDAGRTGTEKGYETADNKFTLQKLFQERMGLEMTSLYDEKLPLINNKF